jgi:epoxyqueuosine reductase
MQPSLSARLGPSRRSEIRALVIERALALGAGDVRIVSALADTQSRERMEASFRRGDLASWGYDERYASSAADPASVLDGARSVICIAVPYVTPAPQRSLLRGRVSNYAWSRDYHRSMRALLANVATVLDEAAGAPVSACTCDTKPIAERAFAARAGLGWIGKHTNLISPELGSFVFLGEIVTTLDLLEDAPLRKTCGSCVRCVDACPTGALRGDYTIDATRCIADLNQRTQPVARELRPLIGDWIWGCDLCQLACPPTQRARPFVDRAFEPLDEVTAAPLLVELLRLRSAEFKRRYQATAMGWRGAAVLRRNAAIGLGNALDRSTVPALVQCLCDDPHPMVRGAAAWALGRIGSPAALEALARALAVEANLRVREEVVAALNGFAREPGGKP